jgi:GDPmannose 4,6-dehydratase
MSKKAIIIGVVGQDGSFLAELLHKKNYEVYGVVKVDVDEKRIDWIKKLVPEIIIYKENVLDKKALEMLIRNINPDEIYNFASYSNVFKPWEDLDGILNLNAKLPQNILELILLINKKIKYFQASSCLVFGKDKSGFQDEKTPKNPIHPYGVTKLYADNILREFRDEFGLYCCSGIFFNHESERRPYGFFSRKITSSVAKIKLKQLDKIKVGNLNSLRDFGYSPDFMEAVYKMMQNEIPTDYCVGTGKLISMENFIEKCFNYVGLDYKQYIDIDEDIYRKNDTETMKANIKKINKDLNWHPETSIDEMIKKMIDNDIEIFKTTK